MQELIKVQNVSQCYQKGNFFSKKKHTALENISFSLKKDRNLGILGKNGAGKSTLVRLLLGLEKPKTGRIEIFGTEHYNPLIKKNIQAIFQDPQSSLNPRFSAKECLLEGIRNFETLKDSNQASKNLAQMVRLRLEYLDKRSAFFSGGEQQRIAIARSIALKPKVLILDEALSNLDTHLQMQIITELRELQKKLGMTFIVISHDIRIILQFCQEIIVLHQGKIVFKTDIEEGLQNAILRDKNGFFKEICNANLFHQF
ncbi:dipeptide/oligopeptide/nickel ABC transporter ATP-binding protein [Helicobacter sp.]|uniref:dipeptide/oligopeptide/nickel ABC transporter ATP-binding protein n=1 Tax=Helicobacter sp. TaxID=218 RepID=UPI002A74F14A|nr:dipeptide/oligopeptide/nickel ABC transporter ATP-binding protein [Helicobacter sp.]MDY2585248.1 dipeptide/oligopeptide/nickel ABC transporter ATP-binding protein [Helicobacter sp.]